MVLVPGGQPCELYGRELERGLLGLCESTKSLKLKMDMESWIKGVLRAGGQGWNLGGA